MERVLCALLLAPAVAAAQRADVAELQRFLAEDTPDDEAAEMRIAGLLDAAPQLAKASLPNGDPLLMSALDAMTAGSAPKARRGRRLAELLLARGADVDAKIPADRTYALRYAFRPNGNSPLKFLLAYAADITVADEQGRTVLHRVVMRPSGPHRKGSLEVEDSLEAARLLLASPHVDVNARTKRGDTALHAAVSPPQPELCELLIAHGADVSAKGAKGRTALELAKMLRPAHRGHPSQPDTPAGRLARVIELLERVGADAGAKR